MWIGLHLVRNGLITSDQLMTAIEYCEAKRPPIGRIAIQKRKLTLAECFQVLSRQAIQPDSFGQIARQLRLLTKRQVADLLLAQSEATPSLCTALVETGALTREEMDREVAQARFERRLREDLDAEVKPTAKSTERQVEDATANGASTA